MYRTTLAIVLTLALAVTNVESCFAKDLIKSLQIETQVYQQVAGAESLISSGQYAAAREILLKAAAQDPTSYSRNVHRNLFLCYRALKQYDKAVSEAKKVLQYDPAYEIAYYDMAQAYYDADKYDQAIDALNKFLAVASAKGAPHSMPISTSRLKSGCRKPPPTIHRRTLPPSTPIYATSCNNLANPAPLWKKANGP
jgi:tetratricopeptide (TPR) repeat protein